MSAQLTSPVDYDIGAIGNAEDWPQRELPARRRGNGSNLVVKRSVLNEIHAHGRETSEVEVCGVLIGNVYRDLDNKPFVHIEGCIRGNYAAGKSAQVTFTAETWTHIQDVLDADHPDKRILGWYHTHPGYGIFLSDMDVFIHKNFFNLPWHTAFVYDPKQNQEGLFVWRAGDLIPEDFMVQEDVLAEDVPTAMSTQMTAGAAPPGTMMELTARIQTLEQRQKWLLAGLALCAMLSIGWPILMNAVMPVLRGDLFSFPRSNQQQHTDQTDSKDAAPVQPETPKGPAKFVAPEYGALFPKVR
ncbi:MAG TPA: Mov34/MPN/PAD-1 family protein [Tepidisphaeraceae bacterium]|jgi:proteasome lid subunit RPN8/RPN11